MSAFNEQEGGNHYKDKAIQPVEYCMANNIPFMEGSAIKYLTRWRDKGGIQDLKKARHFINMLIEYEEREGITCKQYSNSFYGQSRFRQWLAWLRRLF